MTIPNQSAPIIGKGSSGDEVSRDALIRALGIALGYMLNAQIDLETGAPKKTALATIKGGIEIVRAALKQVGTE